MKAEIRVVGAGLAGCEAAWAAACAGIPVTLYEMKPRRFSPAHHTQGLAELVCSNSFKAARLASAAGLLKEEMRLLGSLCLRAADRCAVPAGGALAVDRDLFSAFVTEAIAAHPLIRLVREEITDLPDDGVVTVIATGPLTADALAGQIAARCGGMLSFYDAAAPIIAADSVDETLSFRASRYDREQTGEGEYVNCPMDREQYTAFRQELIRAQRAHTHAFDVYEGCMPIEVLARTGRRPWAVLQLRRENAQGTLLNLVGFQTNLTFPEQKRVFSMIPALHDAVFHRYGVMHRNTFLHAQQLLTPGYRLRGSDTLFFAGQMTGVEGYMESAGSGIVAGRNAVRLVQGRAPLHLPRDTMLGALAAYVSGEEGFATADFQPMGANFGLLPALPETIRDKKMRYAGLADRALESLRKYLKEAEETVCG